MKRVVKYANPEDIHRWLLFASKLKEDFYGLDLGKDKKYGDAVLKNIARKTAIYVEDEKGEEKCIIGGMIYSRNQNHIGWLGVDSCFRRQGIATFLLNHMVKNLRDAKEIRVKTFLNNDVFGKAARSFYRKNGFIPGRIESKNEDYPHDVQEFVKDMSNYK